MKLNTQSWCGMVTLANRSVMALALACACSAPAYAETKVIGFTTYLREGPSVRYAPIDEALSAKQVDVLSCAQGWRRIAYDDAVGYVSEGALVSREPSDAVGDHPTCLVNRIAGYHGGPDVTFCSPGSAATAR